MNIYEAHPQGRGVPARKPPRTEFTALPPAAARSVRIKLQIYNTTVPCAPRVQLAFSMNENVANAERGRMFSARDLNSREARPIYISRDTYGHWLLRLSSETTNPTPRSMERRLSARRFRTLNFLRIGQLVRRRLEVQ